MKNIYIYILIFVLFVQYSSGSDFRYLRTNEGLINGEINSIAQDQSGKIWFATWSGLTSFNGFEFQFFKPELGNPYSLPDKKIGKIFIDSKDRLWVSSLSGVLLFNKEKLNFHSISLEGVKKDYYLLGFFEIKGNVIIHTTRGLFLVEEDTGSEAGYKAVKLHLYNSTGEVFDYINVAKSFDDRLILVTNGYNNVLPKIYISELVIEKNIYSIKINKEYPFNLSINAIEYSKAGNRLFLATANGLYACNLGSGSLQYSVYFNDTNVMGLLIASDQKLYGFSNKPELLYLDLNSGQNGCYLPDPMKIGTILDNNIICLFEDFSENLWIGSQGQGVSILNLNQKEFHSYKRDPSIKNSLSNNTVMCFNSTNDEVFVGLRQGGINVTSKRIFRNEPAGFQSITYNQQTNTNSGFNSVWDIARESDSVFWVASDLGVAKLKKKNNRWVYGSTGESPLYSNGAVRKILVDEHRNIWVGTFSEGLIFFPALRNNPTKQFFHFPSDSANNETISDRSVLSMLIDSKKRFWVGTVNGLNLLKTPYDKLDLSGRTKPDIKFKQYVAVVPKKDFLNANEINNIFENKDGKLWVATQGGGINIMNADSDTFSQITVDNGMPGNDVQVILPDKAGIIWASTNKGIVSFDQHNQNKPFTFYNYSDGIQGETFKVNSGYKTKEGELFFGGDNGFTRFFPEDIKVNPIPPKIGLTNLRILNKVVKVGDTISSGNIMSKALDELDEIVLPFYMNSFSLGIGIHHYQFPEGNMIRYKLDGYNDRWITLSASNKYIYFSKLPEGKYILHINALSADNIEASEDRILKIHILPPWYSTWYMITIYILFIIALIGGLFSRYVKHQRISFQEKIDAVSFESNENKMKFLTNIAHELRTPLSLVIAPIEDLMLNYSNIEPKWKNHISLIYRNSNYLLTLINQIIDFRKLNAGKLQLNLQICDLGILVKEVVSNFKGIESRRKTNLQVHVPELPVYAKIDSQKIEEVLYNLLSNAFKHTGDKQLIVVDLELIKSDANDKKSKNDQIKITVFNEGKDISDDDKVKIFERFYKVSENVDGAGIGLSFSKSLIEMHHGTIAVESVEGKGVAFCILLPFNEISDNELVSDIDNHDSFRIIDDYDDNIVHELDDNDKELTLVIVEDNIDLRSFLKNILSVTYNVFEAGDGREGYELITKIIPDIVISDIIMPKMDGYELCEKVKENSKTCHIPIILLTANNASEHVISGYEKGADAYVTKPFDMTIIKAQISRLIKNRELIREKYMTHNFMVEVSTSNMSRDDEFIVKLRQLLENNLSQTDFNVKTLSSDLNISTTHLYRKLKALTGYSPVEFIRIFKLQKACELLSNSDYSIKEIGYSLGFNNLSYFVKCFRVQYGTTPSGFRQHGMPDTSSKSSTNQSGVS